VHDLSSVEDCVAMHGDRVDAVKASTETESTQRINAIRLEKLTDDVIWLGEGAFEEGNAKGCGARCRS
jgi:hypothetical protein